MWRGEEENRSRDMRYFRDTPASLVFLWFTYPFPAAWHCTPGAGITFVTRLW
jgi:hypothetical protein